MGSKKKNNSRGSPEKTIAVTFLFTEETNDRLDKFLAAHREIKKGMFADQAVADRIKKYESINI
jgi:predicted transcriptional regulator